MNSNLQKEGIRVKRDKNFFRGCLIGGAIGDALGWPVEFMRCNDIFRKYGENGVTGLSVGKNGKAEISDDTQMTIFSAEGILRANTRMKLKGICHVPSVVYHAYLRWLHTQGYPKIDELNETYNGCYCGIYDGWIIKINELHHRRAPGNTCISALQSKKMGTIEEPINNSKGCGGVMRVAPIGLLCNKDRAFELACECAALTHGHQSGYLSAGVLAHIVASLVDGLNLEKAVSDATSELKKYQGHEECSRIIEKAVALSKDDIDPRMAISLLGEGWVGEEAIAIAIYCALKYKNDFRKALCLSVNHNGDSDSTGAITGNILGAYLGIDNIPAEWANQVELSGVLAQLADDLLLGFEDTETWCEKYPGF